MNDTNSLSHTKWNCKYHMSSVCGGMFYEDKVLKI